MKIEMREDFYRGWVCAELLAIDDDDHEGERAIATTSSKTKTKTSVPEEEDAAMNETKRKMLTDGVLEFVERHGTYAAPYKWGGTLDTPDLGLDCSGLVQTAFATASAWTLWLPRDAYQQRDFVDPVMDAADAAPGDLVFFGPSQNKVDHVAIVITATPVVPSHRRRRNDNARTTTTQQEETEEEEEEGVVIRYAHCSCESTGRNGVGFDAVFVPAADRGEGPRPPPESAGDPVAEYYGRRFLCLGRVMRGVQRSEDVIWRRRV